LVRIAFFMPVAPKWIDSYAFIRAGQQALNHPALVYDQAAVQVATAQTTQAFLYPPSALALFVPFGWLADWAGIDKSAIVWLLVEVAALVAGFFLWIRATGLRPTVAAPLAAVLAISAPTVSDINSGQINGVAILLATLGAFAFPERRAGVWMGVALAIKPALLPILMIPLVTRRWVVSLIAVAVGVVAQLCLIPLVGGETVVAYFTTLLPSIAATVVQDANNISPANLFTTWLGGRPPYPRSRVGTTPWHFPQLATLLIALLRLAVVGLIARASWLTKDFVTAFAFVLAAIPVLAGTTWLHYVVFTYPLIIVGAGRLEKRIGLYLTALALLLLDPFLNIVFVSDWANQPDPLGVATLIHIDVIGIALVLGLLLAFAKLTRLRSGSGAERDRGLVLDPADIQPPNRQLIPGTPALHDLV
jgi:hypothetical protein